MKKKNVFLAITSIKCSLPTVLYCIQLTAVAFLVCSLFLLMWFGTIFVVLLCEPATVETWRACQQNVFINLSGTLIVCCGLHALWEFFIRTKYKFVVIPELIFCLLCWAYGSINTEPITSLTPKLIWGYITCLTGLILITRLSLRFIDTKSKKEANKIDEKESLTVPNTGK